MRLKQWQLPQGSCSVLPGPAFQVCGSDGGSAGPVQAGRAAAAARWRTRIANQFLAETSCSDSGSNYVSRVWGLKRHGQGVANMMQSFRLAGTKLNSLQQQLPLCHSKCPSKWWNFQFITFLFSIYALFVQSLCKIYYLCSFYALYIITYAHAGIMHHLCNLYAVSYAM